MRGRATFRGRAPARSGDVRRTPRGSARQKRVTSVAGVLVAGSLVASLLLSALGTAASVRYAQRRNLIDHPGRRRSHLTPTPRGGGIGIVVAALVIYACETVLLPREARIDLLACATAVALVAAVGWIDDHGGLAARWRLLAHFVAAALVLAPALIEDTAHAAGADGIAAAALVVAAGLGLVWSINLHNFMDGIDGLLAMQALFVFAALAAIAAGAGAPADAWHLTALAAAVVGFLPFNFPRARVFMGDVGSGALGLLIGIAVLRQAGFGNSALFGGLIVVSAFVVDATCNLLSRMLRGRRWYSAHREHLYQWLARSGWSHPRVVGWYMGWNLAIVTPALIWLCGSADRQAGAGAAAAAIVYGLGVALWIYGKRWCLNKIKSQRRHANA